MNQAIRLGIFFLGPIVALPSARGEAGKGLAEGIRPLITTSEMVVGINRFAFGLLKAGNLLDDADVKLRLYAIDGSGATLAALLPAPYQTIGNAAHEPSVHRHSDGTRHLHDGNTGIRGLDVAQLSFSRAGDWGVELLVSQQGGAVESVRFAVAVHDKSPTPALGSDLRGVRASAESAPCRESDA